MRKFLIVVIFVFALILSLFGCKSKKKIAAQHEPKIKTAQQYLQEGYHEAVIVFNELNDSACTYLIQLENGSLLEPLQLDDDFKEKKIINIWLKYLPQRRLSRCNAQPIQIIDIINRE